VWVVGAAVLVSLVLLAVWSADTPDPAPTQAENDFAEGRSWGAENNLFGPADFTHGELDFRLGCRAYVNERLANMQEAEDDL
jgi:hypothetical protein